MLFWDVQFDTLEVERDSDFILPRILEFGRLQDVGWLVATYGFEHIHQFLRDRGHPELLSRVRRAPIAESPAQLNGNNEGSGVNRYGLVGTVVSAALHARYADRVEDWQLDVDDATRQGAAKGHGNYAWCCCSHTDGDAVGGASAARHAERAREVAYGNRLPGC